MMASAVARYIIETRYFNYLDRHSSFRYYYVMLSQLVKFWQILVTPSFAKGNTTPTKILAKNYVYTATLIQPTKNRPTVRENTI